MTAGPIAVGTGIISQDNDDPTAHNMTHTLAETGFLRSDVVLWNVVPYCDSTIDRNRNPTVAQIKEAIPYTQVFIDELKSLKVAVYCGLHAHKAQKYLRFPAGVHQQADQAVARIATSNATAAMNSAVSVLDMIHTVSTPRRLAPNSQPLRI